MGATRRATALAAATLACASSALAQNASYDGRYKLTQAADCATPVDTPGFLLIEDGVLTGAESSCRMTNPIDVRDMDATLYDMMCTGEGTVWSERAMLMRGAEGELVLVWNGYAFAYPACPVSPMRPRRRPEQFASGE